MKVLHINTHDVLGGAARAAYRLHAGLRGLGVDSRMLVRTRHSDDSSVEAIPHGDLLQELCDTMDADYVRPLMEPGCGTFSFAHSTAAIAEHPYVREADILHLHWVPHFLEAEVVRSLARLGKPLFWTLHDLWPLTGGCHYAGACQQFHSSCESCPAVVSSGHSKVKREHERKRVSLGDLPIHAIAPSQWMANQIASSAVGAAWTRDVLHYGIDTGVFGPGSRSSARQALGIPSDRVCLLFGCHAVGELRKGLKELCDALRSVKIDAELLIFGGGADKLPDLPANVRSLGQLKTDQEIARAYVAADAFLCPTLEDNLPNTVMESLSCGTPVIGFATGGVPELVSHEANGLLAPTGDVGALAQCIQRFVDDEGLRSRLQQATEKASRLPYALETQASAMLELYRKQAADTQGNFSAVAQGADVPIFTDPDYSVVTINTLLGALQGTRLKAERAKAEVRELAQQAKEQAAELKRTSKRVKECEREVDEWRRHPWRGLKSVLFPTKKS